MPLLGFCIPIQAWFAWLPWKRRYTVHFLSLPSFFSLSLYTSPTTNATMARGRSRNANKRSVALNAALSIGPRKFRFKMCICRNAGKFHILALRVCLEGTSEGTEEAKWRIVESRKVDSSHTSRITGYILPNTCQFGASITYRGCYITWKDILAGWHSYACIEHCYVLLRRCSWIPTTD